MTTFSGFPNMGRSVPLPAAFFAELLPQITDTAELKVTLHVFWRLSERKVFPRFLTGSELDVDRVLSQSLAAGGPPLQELRRALKLAVARGSILEVIADRGERHERLFFINTERDRLAVERIESGRLQIGQTSAHRVEPEQEVLRPNVFSLYEANIGLLTPMIADELRAAEQEYPAEWLEEAFKLAVGANKRSWRYISVILARWRNEGKDDGTARKDLPRDSWERYHRPGTPAVNR